MLVGDREIVESGGIGRIELGGAFPAIDRLSPESALRDLNAEFDLLLGLVALSGERGSRVQSQERNAAKMMRENMSPDCHYSGCRRRGSKEITGRKTLHVRGRRPSVTAHFQEPLSAHVGLWREYIERGGQGRRNKPVPCLQLKLPPLLCLALAIGAFSPRSSGS